MAEVYDGEGRFLANGADQRHVRTATEDGRTRIDLSFVGPLKFSGHYYIESKGDHRLYQGPVNCGYAHSLGKDGVHAHAYWPSIGLSQKFLLMLAPDGQRQLSLALMSRGEQLLYVVVGENARMSSGQAEVNIPLVNGCSFDLGKDPKAGRSEHYLLRPGYWEGELTSLTSDALKSVVQPVRQTLKSIGDHGYSYSLEGGVAGQKPLEARVHSNAWQEWSEAGSLVGSSSFYGGRALSGQWHHLPSARRLWRREVVAADGLYKAVLQVWYEGENKIASEWGFLRYRSLS